MRLLAVVPLTCWLGVAAPATVSAQSVTSPPAPTASDPQAGPGSKPQPQPPAEPQQPAPTTPDAAAELTRSLFEQTWHQFEFGGRSSSVDGDPARFQRYEDIRDGVLFNDARFAREDPAGAWFVRAAADNVGWRDQRFFGEYERPGRFIVSGLWDEIPQFYSVDTKTPYTGSGGTLVLDDATQRLIQNGQANLSAYVPIAPQFELRERRDIGEVRFKATPTPQLDVTAAFTTQSHVGELPWGSSFGFGNDVEVGLPYNSRANDFSLGTEWTNGRQMLRVAYTGSWFDNHDDTLVWDSPLRADDSTSAPGRGRMSLWPSNSAQTVSAGGFAKFARRTQLTGFISFGSWNNDEPLQPFTINATLPQFTLPRTATQAEASIFSTNLNLVSRPVTDWRTSARLRVYDFNNQAPHTEIPQFINYDTSVKTSSTGGPELYAHSRTTFDADATWNGLQPLALTAGYTRNNSSHDFRIFESTGEDVLRLTADAVGSQWVTFRAQYELGSRSGSDLDEELLVEIGEQPDMRHYDVANRTRNRFTGQMDVVPNDLWTFSLSTGFGKDDYDDSYFGLQQSTFRTFSIGADFRQPNGFGAGATYNYEHYEGDQRSRQASPGSTPPQENDPNRDWTVNSKERVNYVSIYAWPPRFGRDTEARVSWDYSHANGTYFYAIVPGGPLTPPNQLPDVFNKLQQLQVDVRHRLSNRLVASLAYLYEPFRVYDFAFDPTVVNGIVQPSSLVLGYVYRPYTAHSARFGLRYYW
jgi:MtrB/PioB family decaheme-associated outer membrane protein